MADTRKIIELVRSKKDIDEFNETVLKRVMIVQAFLEKEGDALIPVEITGIRDNIASMKRVWDRHTAELEAPSAFECPVGLSELQREVVARILQEAFTEGMTRTMAVALIERVSHEIQRIRGTLPRFED